MHNYDHTINWHQFWIEANSTDRTAATPSTHHLIDILPAFIAEKDVLNSFADVGCGPALVAFDVAERHSETTVVGYDAATSILAENRQRIVEDNMKNLHFEQAMFPAFDPSQQFDLVLCYATLDYVADSERALRNLYDAVVPGGHLMMNYPNRFTSTLPRGR